MTVETLSYAIDDEDRLIKVDEGYYRFAAENGWEGAGASLGRSLWDFVAGHEVKKLQRLLLRRVRGGVRGVELPFRCDGPDVTREMDIRIAADKQEFLAACDDFALDRSLRAYSTIGTRGDVDLVLLSQSPNLEDLHTFHVVLGQSGLAKWTETPYSFLSMTKRSPYSEEQARPEICVSERKYLFLYPMVKQRRWYGLPAEERQRIMKSHIEVGRRHPEITINTSYSFGLDDQEFVVAFEGDDPGEFLDLVQELRPTESSAYTERETPIFTCVAMSVRRALDALDGTTVAAASASAAG